MIRTLNRIRLRLGLFRWKNYGSIRWCPPFDDTYDLVIGVWEWTCLGRCDYTRLRRDAIAHIRKCVKSGKTGAKE